jgi:hypothetical protein
MIVFLLFIIALPTLLYITAALIEMIAYIYKEEQESNARRKTERKQG